MTVGEGPILKVISPTGEERTIACSGAEIQVGSDIDSTLVLAGHGVSSKHCKISLRGEKLVVTDRGSRNGTFINSIRCVEPTLFNPGDRLSVGAYVIAFVGERASRGKQRLEPVSLTRGEDEVRADEVRRLADYAREWVDHGRVGRLLLRGRDLALAEGWIAVPALRAEVEAQPLLREFIAASTRGQQIRLALRMTAIGMLLGGLVVALLLSGGEPAPLSEVPPPVALPSTPIVAQETGPAGPAVREAWIEHKVSPGETYDELAHYYAVSIVSLKEKGPRELMPGDTLRIMTARPPRAPLVEEHYVVGEGEDWRTVADLYSMSAEKLRAFNPRLGERLGPGDQLTLWIDAGTFGAQSQNAEDLPIFIVPAGSSSVGGVTSGTLVNPVQLLPSPLAEVRCASHAYATNFTISKLLSAVAAFRSGHDYKGQVMIADLSMREGGKYGHHKSHQSGRDADIWLLPKFGRFKAGCNNCSTSSCRPEPEEVDWRMTWRLIRALHGTGELKEIFLSRHLQKSLHEAALALGETKDELKTLIQWPRSKGIPALVMHSDGHIHHIHVRFKCDPTDQSCSDEK